MIFRTRREVCEYHELDSDHDPCCDEMRVALDQEAPQTGFKFHCTEDRYLMPGIEVRGMDQGGHRFGSITFMSFRRCPWCGEEIQYALSEKNSK